MAEDAAQLLDVLGIDKVHLGGMSIGASVAQEFAIAWPERLLSLSLHCSWAKSDEWFIRAIETIEYPAARGDIHAYLRFALMWVLSPRFLAEKPDEVAAITRTYIDDNPFPPSADGILGHTNADKLHDVLDRLPQIRVRTLVTAGEMDWLVPPRYSEVVARAIPGARWHLFRGDFSSHCACVEMAAEWNRVLRPGGRAVILVAEYDALRIPLKAHGWKATRLLKVRILGQTAVLSVWQKPEWAGTIPG